jgi:mRNA interferase RelE/StbE
MSHTLQIKPAALRQLGKLPRPIQRRIREKVEALRDNPFPPSCKKLVGVGELWRVRAGDYRVVYEVRRGVLIVLVVAIGHRSDVYR